MFQTVNGIREWRREGGQKEKKLQLKCQRTRLLERCYFLKLSVSKMSTFNNDAVGLLNLRFSLSLDTLIVNPVY